MTEDKGRVLGEAENVGPGLESSFSLNLDAGSYTTYCPGGSKEYGTLEVAEADTGQTGDPAAQQAAVATYLAYVQQQADEGVVRVQRFADAVNAGDVAQGPVAVRLRPGSPTRRSSPSPRASATSTR